MALTENHGYEKFIIGIDKYFEYYDKGLKKQANNYIKNFVNDFEKNVPESERDEILYRLCCEMLDEGKHERFLRNGGIMNSYRFSCHLPHELNRIVWEYLKRQCELEKMPHMRWIFQIYNTHQNPFDPKGEYNTYKILEKAYNHNDCDQKTVDLYFYEQIKWLEWGAHHFPEGCIITKESYEETVKTAEKIISERYVCLYLKEALDYFVKLYDCFYKYTDSGEDFYKLCDEANIRFPTYY